MIGSILARYLRTENPLSEKEIEELESVLNALERGRITAPNWPQGRPDYVDVTNAISTAVPDATTAVKGKASFNASDFNVSSGAVTIDYTNGQRASATQVGFSDELATIAEALAGSDGTRVITPNTLRSGITWTCGGLVSNPQAMYTQRPQIFMMLTQAAITITRIKIQGPDSTPGAELAGDLKFADDMLTGTFANATVIDVCDTTSGSFSATSFDDATVPSGKYIYFSMDASPNADWKDFLIEFDYTVDD